MEKLISLTDYIKHKNKFCLIDVRTPKEFKKGHIPNAKNLPIFSNEDRVKIGTTYKQKGRENAVLLGLELTGPKWRSFVEEAIKLSSNKPICLHCWRGGMRSEAMAWVLRFYGLSVSVIKGGYKTYRHWALDQFEKEYPFLVLGGLTGSHKTEILAALQKAGEVIVDLEGLAQHQGSAFGSMNKMEQPSQEHFENQLAMHLYELKDKSLIWIEDESRNIGKRILPKNIFDSIRAAKVIEVKLPKAERVEFLTEEYGCLDKEFLIDRTTAITKRLGPQHTKEAIDYINKGELENFIEKVLVYYDKMYTRGLNKRKPNTRFPIELEYTDKHQAASEILQFIKKNKIIE